jgi:hypothetical protein
VWFRNEQFGHFPVTQEELSQNLGYLPAASEIDIGEDVALTMNLEESERRAQEYVKTRLEPTSMETLNARYDKKSEEFTITFRVTDKNGARREVRVKYDKDGTLTGYELKQDKKDRY